MKNLVFISIIAALTVLMSCSEDDVLSGSVSGDRILNDFFVTSIKFDNSGNAWIGTFKQGVIKYNDRKSTLFNSSNSPLDGVVVNSIAIDSKNNIWIGANGLVKYDGKEFKLYNNENTPIPENYIHSINIDKDDNIWFSSSRHMTGGVVKFDGNNKWNTFIYKDTESGIEGCIISGIAIAGDNVWAGIQTSDNNHLMKISSNNETTYIGNDQGLEAYSLGRLCADKNSNVYMIHDYSYSSALVFNDGPHLFVTDGKSINAITCPYGEINLINTDSKGNLWCVRSFNSRVLLRYNGKEWVDFNIIREDEDNTIFCIEEAPDGKIWLGTGKGIYIIDV